MKYTTNLFYAFCILLIGCNLKNPSIQSVFRYNEHKNIGSLDPAFSKDIADIWAT
ncbi:MAG: ABC transporter substrate-binding protein, partial [Aquaticitalea sp.]